MIATATHARISPVTHHGLDDCEALLARHLDTARRSFGPAALGVIDLPQLPGGRLIADQIRVCAALYWTYEVEQAGLVPMIEALAEGVMRGTIVEPLGSVVPELTRFWRAREHRFSQPERAALFARVFGDPARQPSAFDDEFVVLVSALVALSRSALQQQTTHLEARVAVAAQQLGATLSQQGVGIAAFAARDIVDQIRTALRLLQHADLVRVLGGGSPWELVARHAPRLIGREVAPDRHISRATSGMRIIAWIAAESQAIESGALHLSRAAPVVREAEAWSAASGVA